jgi:DNA-binding NarL/FixJ family response regulator
VILIDFELPDGDGADATSQINAILPRAKVVIVTARTDDDALLRCVAAGCTGFVTKFESIASLVAAIHAAHLGETVTPVSDLAPLIRELQPTRRGLGASLGPREIEVLALVASGRSNKQIAQQLTLSLNTVRNHVQSVLRKLQAHSKLEAVATGVREGVIDYPGKFVGHSRE